MSFESAFLELMPQTVTVNAFVSRTAGGAPTFSTSATSVRARVVNIHKQMRDAAGNVVMGAYEAWLASTSVLAANSKYTLPDGTSPPVLSVTSYPDDDGNHHVKVVFGAG